MSRWSSADTGAEFAGIYARSLNQRYKKAEGAASPAPDPAAQTADSKPDLLKGRHAWTTEDGAVIIDEQGDTVFVSESLDATTTATIEKEVFGATPAHK